MVICPQCGRENAESTRFCASCGAYIALISPTVASAEATVGDPPAEPEAPVGTGDARPSDASAPSDLPGEATLVEPGPGAADPSGRPQIGELPEPRPLDSAPPPPPRARSRRNIRALLSGLGVGVVAVCVLCGLACVALSLFAPAATDTPDYTVTRYYDALRRSDCNEAVTYLTQKTSPPALRELARQTCLQDLAQKGRLDQARIQPSAINGESATVSVDLRWARGKPETRTHALIKEDGNWRVVF